MKKSIFILLLFVGLTVSAQSQFKGFFKPVTFDKPEVRELIQTNSEFVIQPNKAIFRPTWAIEAIAIDKNGNSQSLSAVGMGISWATYIEHDLKPYCKYSINALFLTSVKLNGENKTNLGAAITVDVFNKLIGGGIGYLDKKFLLLTTISYPL